jgi:hypothetical protein
MAVFMEKAAETVVSADVRVGEPDRLMSFVGLGSGGPEPGDPAPRAARQERQDGGCDGALPEHVGLEPDGPVALSDPTS